MEERKEGRQMKMMRGSRGNSGLLCDHHGSRPVLSKWSPQAKGIIASVGYNDPCFESLGGLVLILITFPVFSPDNNSHVRMQTHISHTSKGFRSKRNK